MRIAVISDIHGNMEAFQKVAEDIRVRRIDAVISLGDNIGYGPESEEVARLIRQSDIPSVMGNHELGLVDRTYLANFNTVARASLLQIGSQLSNVTIDYICTLKPYLVSRGIRFVHGFPPDSVVIYQFQVTDAEVIRTLGQYAEAVCFTGHTHYLEIIDFDGRKLARRALQQETIRLKPGHRYIINIGSVGQPRDGDKRAKYAIMDTDADTVEIRYTPYDVMKTVKKILKAGLPAGNARRLMKS